MAGNMLQLTFLIVSFCCLVDNIHSKKVYVCRNQQKTIRCPGSTIKINKASYGRSNSHTCTRSDNKDFRKCSIPATDSIKEKCDGKPYCLLFGNRYYLGIKGECSQGSNEYTTIKYECGTKTEAPEPQTEPKTPAINSPEPQTEPKTPAVNSPEPQTEPKTPAVNSPEPQTEPKTPAVNRNKMEEKNVLVCQHDSKILKCDADEKISICSVFWGRNDKTTCDDGWTDTTTCSSRWAFGKVKRLCNGYQSCELYASSSEFGNPCYFTTKYLKVKYNCVKIAIPTPSPTTASKPIHKIVCKDVSTIIKCKKGKRLSFTQASFGRQNNDVCPVSEASGKEAEKCMKSVLKFFMFTCDRREYCLVTANSKFYGEDHCPETSKYLALIYQCI